jgi:hypothetical protein
VVGEHAERDSEAKSVNEAANTNRRVSSNGPLAGDYQGLI